MNTTTAPRNVPLVTLAPDTSAMATSLNLMNDSLFKADVLFASTRYLPHLYEKFKRLNTVVITEQQQLAEHCARVVINVESNIPLLRACNLQLNSNKDPEENAELQAERSHLLKASLSLVSAEGHQLNKALSLMTANHDRQQTQKFQQSLSNDAVGATANNAVMAAELVRLTEERRVLSGAIAAIESKGLAGIAKDTVITAQSVMALGMQPPEMALITLALEHMKATIEQGAEGINLIAMFKRRDGLRLRFDTLTATLTEAEKSRLELLQRIELIGHFHAMDEQCAVYAEHYRKIVKTLENFTALNDAPASDDQQRSTRLIDSGLQLVAYLTLIR